MSVRHQGSRDGCAFFSPAHATVSWSARISSRSAGGSRGTGPGGYTITTRDEAMRSVLLGDELRHPRVPAVRERHGGEPPEPSDLEPCAREVTWATRDEGP
jgi:hypothetical protein